MNQAAGDWSKMKNRFQGGEGRRSVLIMSSPSSLACVSIDTFPYVFLYLTWKYLSLFLRKWATLRLVPKSKVLHQPSEGKVIRFNIEPELNFSGGQLFGKKAKLWRTPLHAQMFLFNLWRAQTLEICTDICKIEKMFGEHDRPSLRGWKLDADRRSSHKK